MKLTREQQLVVNENMGLVGKVIKDKVHGVDQLGIYTYDDIFQIGCIGLCKAAYTDKGGCFSTYAYRLIWNEICSALIYASRRTSTEYATDPELLFPEPTEELNSMDEYNDLENILDRISANSSEAVANGIKALKLTAKGYTSAEIGKMMDASPGNVRVWISKARKCLKERPELAAL